MCRIRFAIVALLLGVSTAADIAGAEKAEAWTALHAGRHVALMRHTDAPGGAGDPPGFRVDDCATQRNLSAKGRADAARIGARLRSGRDCGRKNPQLAGAAAWTRQRYWNWDRSRPRRHLAMWSC